MWKYRKQPQNLSPGEKINVAVAEKVELSCQCCDKTASVKPTAKGKPRRLNGWKLIDGTLFCPACCQSRYILRAVTLPVVSPLEPWSEFQEAIDKSWAQSTQATAWAVRQLLAADVVRTPDMEKLPPMPRVYLYGLANEAGILQDMPANSRQACFHAAELKYRAKRLDIVWRGIASAPDATYPQPFPVPARDWKITLDESKQPIVSLNIAGKRWHLRLGGGWRYERSIAAIAKIASGEALGGELSIYRQRCIGNRDSGTVTEPGVSGTKRQQWRIMVKIAARLPKSPAKERSGTLYVKTTKDEFLVALNTKQEKLWTLHADQCASWIAEHSRHLRHASDDRKLERRKPRDRKRREMQHTADRIERHRRRIDTWLHTAARQLVQYADRGKFACIHWDESEGHKLPSFPWFKLKLLIQQKCDELGIEFSEPSGKVSVER